MFVEGNEATILLFSLIAGVLLVGAVFVFIERPVADIGFSSDGRELIMSHEGGDSFRWEELRISVTVEKDSTPHYVDPSSPEGNNLGENNMALGVQDEDAWFAPGEAITIYRNSKDGSLLETRKFYHVVIRHKSTVKTIITDKNVWMKPKYG